MEGGIQEQASTLLAALLLAQAEQRVNKIDPECLDQQWLYYNPNGDEHE